MSEVILPAELPKEPKTVMEYFHQKRLSIINDYHTPDGKHSDSCTLIALEIADLLIKEGHEPIIMLISEDIRENGLIHPKSLSSMIFGGRVTWYAHQVCVCDGLAFDPIFANPISIHGYAAAVFGEEIETRIVLTTEKIKEIIGRQSWSR